MVRADCQTSGRGQRGNSWESEPGRNLTFTLFHKPQAVPAREQFCISEAVALAVADFLADHSIEAKVKWPNDIYVGDSKICGILIENSLIGAEILNTRIGAGINVNQTEFLSDAPNPVSMSQLTGCRYDLDRLETELAPHFENRLRSLSCSASRESVHAEFKRRLWRGDGGEHPFRRRGEGAAFPGVIVDVDPRGPISILDTANGCTSSYAFKEVEFII